MFPPWKTRAFWNSWPKVSEPVALNYWRKNQMVISVLMAVWFFVTFVISFLAREWNGQFFGWPFSFFMAAQGALIVYLLLVGVYALIMERLDQETEEPFRPAPSEEVTPKSADR